MKRRIIIGILLILIILEIGLRLSGKLKTHTEKNFGTYQSAYTAENLDHLYVWKKNDTVISTQKEFTYTYYTNSYGLVDKHLLDTCNTDNTIVFLGDSFVFGTGTSQDSSLPILLSNSVKMNIINAGIPGSDPFYQQILLERIFKQKGFYNYIFMINCSDIYDYVIRGGKERFLADNKIAYRKAPWFEPIYKYSYLCRAIIHIVLQADYTLLSKNELLVLKEKAIVEYSTLLKNIAKNNKVLVIIQPYARQYAKNDRILSEVLNYEYLNKLELELKSNNIKTLNLNPELKKHITAENYLKYSWEIDGHYNSKGYLLLSKIISKTLWNE